MSKREKWRSIYIDAKKVLTFAQNYCGTKAVLCGVLFLIMVMTLLLLHCLSDHPVAPGVAECLKQPKILCSLLFWILLLLVQAVANITAWEEMELQRFNYFLNIYLSICLHQLPTALKITSSAILQYNISNSSFILNET